MPLQRTDIVIGPEMKGCPILQHPKEPVKDNNQNYRTLKVDPIKSRAVLRRASGIQTM